MVIKIQHSRYLCRYKPISFRCLHFTNFKIHRNIFWWHKHQVLLHDSRKKKSLVQRRYCYFVVYGILMKIPLWKSFGFDILADFRDHLHWNMSSFLWGRSLSPLKLSQQIVWNWEMLLAERPSLNQIDIWQSASDNHSIRIHIPLKRLRSAMGMGREGRHNALFREQVQVPRNETKKKKVPEQNVLYEEDLLCYDYAYLTSPPHRYRYFGLAFRRPAAIAPVMLLS